jgi:hypothetical protein
VEAVGIEQHSLHRVSPILQGFSRTNRVALSVEERCESGLSDDLGTHVPKQFARAELLAKIRTAIETHIISDDYAETLIELMDVVSAFEPKA